MQTFLPYGSNFVSSALVLDRQRLGKQRVEAWQLLRALDGTTQGWSNHPAAIMWRNHTRGLAAYGQTMCEEWIQRGYKDTMLTRFTAYRPDPFDLPDWINDEAFVLSHRSNLTRKLPEHYRPFWPDVPDDLPYIWPI